MPGTLIQLLATLIHLYSLVLLARVVLSWIPNVNPSNPVIQFLYQITDPVLEPVRRAIPPMGTIDISPLVVLIGLQMLRAVLLSLAGDAWPG